MCMHMQKNTDTLFLPAEGSFSDSSLISHVLVLNFSKGDRQLLLLASEGNHNSATGTSRTLPLSLTAKLQRDREGKAFLRMQNAKQPHWEYPKIFHYPDTREQIKYQMCSLLSLCLCNTMRWLNATSSWEKFLQESQREKKNLRNLRRPCIL